ncbi:MAG: NUDIX hydrolase [Elusimicrobiales bacterium]|nr:NUDIX hydrolase [Elusimicrobiales bacterium]
MDKRDFADLTEKTYEKNTVFNGKAVNFRCDTVILPDGGKATREFLEHPGASAILPVLPDGSIIFVRQYRYPVGQETLEIPAGKLTSKGDDPLKRAIAELEEETGYKAEKYEKLMDFWPTSAFSDETLHLFLATGLTPGKKHPDEDEFINTEILPFEKAWDLLQKGKIKDIKTIIALQAWKIRQLKQN